jgi:hypothetical protein
VSASIGPNGISLDPSGQTATLVPIANQALTALKQAGITVHTVAPVSTVDGPSATVASGALAIQFLDDNIPNPNGQIPLSTVGFLLNLGQSQASANATALPPIPTFPSTGNGGNGGLVSSGNGLAGSAPVTGASALPAPGAQAVASAPARPASGAGAASSQTGAGPTTGALPAPAATLLGAPVKVAWVVIAFLLSLVAAGPLLSYANWQLLRGRKS